MNCDECKHYSWYYDKCTKWDCKVDPREVHNCFESNEIHVIRDIMVSDSQQEQMLHTTGLNSPFDSESHAEMWRG